MIKKFGEELKEARLKEGISLQDIHNKTKVDIKYLESIENGNFEVMPEVYIRAFIKSYASHIGLDVPAVIAKYEAAKSGKVIEEKPEPVHEEIKTPPPPSENKSAVFTSEPVPAPENESAKKSPHRNSILILITGIIFVAAVIAYLFFFKGSSSEIITEQPYDSVITENKKRFESENETIAATPAIYPGGGMDSLNLLIRANATSWFLIKTDSDTIGQDFILYAGNTKIIKAARNYNITVGNSGNVSFILNDRTLNFSGASGEVKSIRIDSTGIRN